MFKQKETFWNNTIVYGFGFLFLRAISFLLLPLYTNLLSAEEAGWVFILYTILAFLNTLYSHGMDSALLKFYNVAKTHVIITTSILYSTGYGIALSLFILLIYNLFIVDCFAIPHIAANYIIIGLIIILLADMLSSRIITLIRLLDKPYYYLLVCFINIVLSVICNIYLIGFLKLGFLGALYSLVVVSIIQLCFICPLIIYYFKYSAFNFILLKQMLSFSMPFLPASIFFILIEMSDRWMLGYLNSVQEVGLYGVGYKIGSLVLLAVQAFNLNWQPFYLKKHLNNPIAKFSSIGTQATILLIFLCTILAISWPLLFQIKIYAHYIIGQSFWSGGYIIPIIGLGYVFYGLFVLQMPSIYIHNKQNWAPVFWGAGFIVNILVNLYLIPLYGMYGAAIATLLAYTVMFLLLFYKNLSWMRLTYQTQHLISFSIMSLFVYYLSLLFHHNVVFLSLCLVCYLVVGGWCSLTIVKQNNILKL